MAVRFEHLVDITDLAGAGERHVWTGEGHFRHGRHLYEPTQILAGVTVAEGGALDGGETRVTLELHATTPELRRHYLIDPGPGQVTIRTIASEDDGVTWDLVPRSFTGRMAAPELVGDRYRIDLVDRAGDPLRPRPRYWSNEDQQLRYPGDLGLSHMPTIAAGFHVQWP